MLNPAIEELALDLLKHADALECPVDPIKVTRALGIDVRLARFKDPTISGILRANGVIYVNYADAPVRQRFTIAHELGHYVLHSASENPAMDLYRDERSSAGIEPREMEANNFAAALLMPAPLVAKLWEEGVRSIPSL